MWQSKLGIHTLIFSTDIMTGKKRKVARIILQKLNLSRNHRKEILSSDEEIVSKELV